MNEALWVTVLHLYQQVQDWCKLRVIFYSVLCHNTLILQCPIIWCHRVHFESLCWLNQISPSHLLWSLIKVSWLNPLHLQLNCDVFLYFFLQRYLYDWFNGDDVTLRPQLTPGLDHISGYIYIGLIPGLINNLKHFLYTYLTIHSYTILTLGLYWYWGLHQG